MFNKDPSDDPKKYVTSMKKKYCYNLLLLCLYMFTQLYNKKDFFIYACAYNPHKNFCILVFFYRILEPCKFYRCCDVVIMLKNLVQLGEIECCWALLSKTLQQNFIHIY